MIERQNGKKLTPEELEARYSTMAQEALEGMVKEDMPEEEKDLIIEDACYLADYIVSRVNGRYRSSSPDVLWSTLDQNYKSMSKKDRQNSPVARFRHRFGNGAKIAFVRLYAMLESGISTMEELKNIDKPVDPLVGLRSGNSTPGIYPGSDLVPPLKSDVRELK